MKIASWNVNTLKKGTGGHKTGDENFREILEEWDIFSLLEVKVDENYHLPLDQYTFVLNKRPRYHAAN